MKQKYNIQIADIHLSVLSDEPQELVTDIVAQLNAQISAMTSQNRRCSKLDAALLCALDLLGEKQKNEIKIKNLEAQISLYETTLARLRNAPEASSTPAVEKEEEPAAETATSPEIEADEIESQEDISHGIRDEKLRQIEELLRRRNESIADEKKSTHESGNTRDDKLRQIEELLRGSGNKQSLSEALQHANHD